ncbi:hypothetical protein [Leptolinea tardivitalis]|nr:hypothetical protein [Leptolinea tardivitalis]GAP22621.1 hypothetical protein LTAR_02857 [Leptolinea tardivitalis]
MTHSWTEKDDLKALYVYLYGVEELPFNIHQIAMMIDTTDDSLKMRVGNFKAVDTDAGLTHVASQSVDVFNKYSKLSKRDLRFKAFGLN